MSYGLKYTSQFDSFKPLQGYQVDIFEKDYTGDSTTVLLSGTPVVQEWQEDDPKAPIRGCTLKVSIITDETGVRLLDFYSEDDAGFYVEFKCTTTDQFLFKGYLLQDDCQEIQVDFNHEIALTFTDMLGTLKNITINEAAVNIGTDHTETGVDFYNPTPVANNTVCSFDARAGVLKAGDTFTLFDGSNTYNLTCFDISYNIALGWCININEVCPFSGTVTFDFTYTIPYPLDGYIPLIDVLKLCLKSTLLNLRLKSYIVIFPQGGTIESTWDDTFIDANTLRVDTNSWMNCYDILEQLMSRFNASLFQADANWAIVRWDEMYRFTEDTGATIRGNDYDEDFIRTGYIDHKVNYFFMDGSDMETGVMKSIERPFQFVKETFNYEQPIDILKNPNLQELGNFIREYEDGYDDLIKEYELPYWTETGADAFIRIAYYNDITQKNFGEEKYRVIVVTGSTANFYNCVKSNEIYLSQGDSFKYIFDWASGVSNPGAFRRHVYIEFIGGPIPQPVLYLDRYGQWNSVFDYDNLLFFSMPSGDNEQDWHTWDITSAPVPYDGILKVYLFEANDSMGTNEFYFRNFNFNIKHYYAGSNNVIGQSHTDSQVVAIKNNDSKDISFDNSPSWYIKGTLYLESLSVGLRDKCTSWGYPLLFPVPVPDRFSFASLGKATTQEGLFTRYKPRAKYEGTYLKILKGNGPYQFLNPLTVFLNALETNKYRFVVGKLAIDYKNANANLTLYELLDAEGNDFEDGLIPNFRFWRQSRIYDFNYLYENK